MISLRITKKNTIFLILVIIINILIMNILGQNAEYITVLKIRKTLPVIYHIG